MAEELIQSARLASPRGEDQRSIGEDKSTVLPIFLSFSKPVFPAQREFIRNLSEGLESFGMKPRTLGVTAYDTGVPLNAIKDLMNNSLGLISVAFRRTHIDIGEKFDDSDGRAGRKELVRDKWLTSPWPHIEVGMAFQIDLPILILRESGVVADGILERGSSAFYLPTFDLDSSDRSYLFSDEWQHIFHKWSRQVRELAGKKEIASTAEDLPPTWSFLRKEETEDNKSGRKESPLRSHEPQREQASLPKAVDPPKDNQKAGERSEARAKYDYYANKVDQLFFKDGEHLTTVEKGYDDWRFARNAAEQDGLIPRNHVTEIDCKGRPVEKSITTDVQEDATEAQEHNVNGHSTYSPEEKSFNKEDYDLRNTSQAVTEDTDRVLLGNDGSLCAADIVPDLSNGSRQQKKSRKDDLDLFRSSQSISKEPNNKTTRGRGAGDSNEDRKRRSKSPTVDKPSEHAVRLDDTRRSISGAEFGDTALPPDINVDGLVDGQGKQVDSQEVPELSELNLARASSIDAEVSHTWSDVAPRSRRGASLYYTQPNHPKKKKNWLIDRFRCKMLIEIGDP